MFKSSWVVEKTYNPILNLTKNVIEKKKLKFIHFPSSSCTVLYDFVISYELLNGS